MFPGASGNGTAGADAVPPGQRPDAEHVFGDVFEEVCSTYTFEVSPTFHHFTSYMFAVRLLSQATGRALS